jgi:exopolyphosphatase/pppGpp-phosphohydrolase
MSTQHAQSSVFTLSRALLIAGGVLAISAALRLLSPEYISAELARRLLGVLLGGLVVVYANAVPKALLPLLQLRCDPAAEQALRRRTGITLLLGGVAYALAWLLAPLATAALMSATLLGAAVLLVVARLGWARWQSTHNRTN